MFIMVKFDLCNLIALKIFCLYLDTLGKKILISSY